MSWDGTRIRFREQSPIAAMLKQNRLDPTLGFFWGLVIVHMIFWTVLAYKTQPNVPSRTLELLTSGRELAWGYPTQPPLGVWVASIFGKIAAPRVWPLYLLAQFCGVVSVWAAWVLARKFLHPWTALCGAIVLLGGYSCTIAASEFSSAHLASAFWSLSILAFHEALTENRRRYWAATGILLALGFLTSYGTLLLLITMFLFTIWNDQARRCWDSSWPFLAALMMSAVMMPHLFWLVQHDFVTIQTKLAPASSVVHHLEQPLAYLGTQLLCLIPVILLLAPLVAWFSFDEPAGRNSDERNFARQYLLWVSCVPPVVIFCLALLAGPSSTLFAGVTNWTFLGIALLLWGHLNETRISWRRSLLRIGSAVGFFAAALVSINLMLPHLSRQAFNIHFPGRDLARQIEQTWKQSGYQGAPPVVAGPKQLVRNAVWNSHGSSRIAMYEDLTPTTPQSPNDLTLLQYGGVIIWDERSTQVPDYQELTRRFGRVSLANSHQLRWKGLADIPDMNIGMAVVHPALAQVAPPATSVPIASQPPASSLPLNYPRLGTPSITPTTPTPVGTPPGNALSGWNNNPVGNPYPASNPQLNGPSNGLMNPSPALNPNTPALRGFDSLSTGTLLGQPTPISTPTYSQPQSLPQSQPQSLPVSAPATRPATDDPFQMGTSLNPGSLNTPFGVDKPATPALIDRTMTPNPAASPGNSSPAFEDILPESLSPNLSPNLSSPVTHPASVPAPVNSQPFHQPSGFPVESVPNPVPGLGLPAGSSAKPALPSGSAFDDILPESLSPPAGLNSTGLGSPGTGVIPAGTTTATPRAVPEYQFSREFLNRYPELGPASGTPASSPVDPFSAPLTKPATGLEIKPAAGSAPALPSQFEAPVTDPFSGSSSLKETSPAWNSGVTLPGSSGTTSKPLPVELRDALPAASGTPGGLQLPASVPEGLKAQ